jgi:hypothetical protein
MRFLVVTGTAFLACFGLAFISSPALAQAIYKCPDPNGISYQQTPCASDEPVAGPSEVPQESIASRATPDCAVKATASPRTAWRNRSLCIGITDDEVLNLPGWGRPSTIDRSRKARGWQELWAYDSSRVGGAAGVLYLRFFNGKLASVEAE